MSQSWLKDLEERVHAASKALRALRAENDKLKARIKELEDRTGGGESWQAEREEIRGRVEKLADHLAELLGDG
ncbi:MAG: hypothetical protein MPN21_06730 [Thermoanaerobaculia bacterium]|nr:hypothetical protein [Thermoanaerobaculia bacterium]